MLNFFSWGKNQKEKLPKIEEKSPVVKEITDRLSALSSLTVKEIMIPRIDTIFISVTASLQELIEITKEEGHSRIPVWKKSVDDIVGLLYVKDLLPFFFQEKPDIDIERLMRPPYFIPESTKVLALLKDFQDKKNHLAIVVDEYGGVSGIVALEDVLEEIVGEIQDEYDEEEEELIVELENNVYLLDSRANIDDINLALQLDLPPEQIDTIGGFVFGLFGRIPKQDEVIHYQHLEFQITNIEGNRINKIKITIHKPTEKLIDFEEK